MTGERSALEELQEFEAEAPGNAPPPEADPAPEPEAETLTAEAPEAVDAPDAPDEDAEAAARRMGWRPKDEWKGDDSNWVDAAEFLDRARNAPGTIRKLEAALRRQEEEQARSLKAMQAIMRRQYEDRIAALEEKRAQAREIHDLEAYDAATQALEQARRDVPRVQAPQPDAARQVAEFREATPWAQNDAAWQLAVQAVSAGLQSGRIKTADFNEQVKYAEAQLRPLYPHLFEPETPRPASPVDGGGRLPRPGKRAKGWDDMPAAERAFMETMIGKGQPYKDRAEAAVDFWKEFGNG